MQRRFGGKIYPQNAKIKHSKTAEKSIVLDQNKNFFKILKKSVAKIVRFFCATCLIIFLSTRHHTFVGLVIKKAPKKRPFN